MMEDSTAGPMDGQHTGRFQSRTFLLLYALAIAGGAIAYVPFLTILLPVRVELMAGEASVAWLAYIAFAGAVAASVANIGFGWLSDITHNRRGWVLAGLVLSSAFLIALTHARGLPMIIGLLIAWQLSLNMMLGPLVAWAGDVVPDRQKGTLGGLLALAPATGAASGALVTIPGMAGADARIMIIVALVVICVMPVLVFGRPVQFPDLKQPNHSPREASDVSRKIVSRMWLARLLVQIAEAALFAYLYLWLRSLSSAISDSDSARLFGLVLLLAVPVTLWAGRWADRQNRPIKPLRIAAGVSAAALMVMAIAPGISVAIFGYAIFGIAAGVFLALHSAQTLRVLPKPQNRGRDLGFFNLTNTTPSLIMPALTLTMVPAFDFAGLFVALAVLAAVACLLLMTVSAPK